MLNKKIYSQSNKVGNSQGIEWSDISLCIDSAAHSLGDSSIIPIEYCS